MSGKNILIYKSKTGFTERYAGWISEKLTCDVIPFEKRKEVSLGEYDTIIFGGSFHAGMISGIKWLKEKLPELAEQKVVVFATGASPAESPDVEKAVRQNFTDAEWEKVKVFYMQSGLSYEKMGIADKLMMAVFRSMVKKTEGVESQTYKMISHSYDIAKQEAVNPLIEYCQN